MKIDSDSQRAAILAHALPRRTQQPNRLDPFDCTLACRALKNCVRWKPVARGTTAVQHVLVGKHGISILESQGTYATRLWHSSVVLSRWLAANKPMFDGRTVLELGAGTGLCSLALAATTSACVIASDSDEAGLALLQTSADGQALKLGVRLFDICSDEPLPPCDCLVASDLL